MPLGGCPGASSSRRSRSRPVSIEPTHRFDLLVRGGTVVRADGSLRRGRRGPRWADRGRGGGASRRHPRHASSTPPACWCCRASSTSTPTPASPSDDEPDRFFQDTVAAAFGGTTTMLAFNNPGTGHQRWRPAARCSGGVREWLDRTRGDAAIDIGLSAVITAQQSDPVRDLPAVADLGVASCKCFLVYDFGIDEAAARRVLRGAADAGILLEVHGEDRALLDAGIASQLDAGRDRPAGSCRLPATRVRGDRHRPCHRHRGRAGRAGLLRACLVRGGRGRDRGRPAPRPAGVSARPARTTCPWMLRATNGRRSTPWARSSRRPCGRSRTRTRCGRRSWPATWTWSPPTMCPTGWPWRSATPASRSRRSRTARRASRRCSRSRTAWASGGGRMTVERLVDVLSTTPARLFGMPAKGAVEVGRDADLVLFDPAARRTIRQADLHHTSDFTPYEGMAVPGAVRDGPAPRRGRHPRRRVRWHTRPGPLRGAHARLSPPT